MRLLSILPTLVLSVACGPDRLANTHSSADSLGRDILSAIAQRDDAKLRALALNEEEFRAQVWPGLPAARPERNTTFSYVWGDLRQKSDNNLRLTLATHGGRRYDLLKVTFAGPVTAYPGFRVHRKAVFAVRDSSKGETELRLCGSFLEKDGAWKVFSYVVDD